MSTGVMMMMMMVMSFITVHRGRILNINNVEVSHHTRLVVFQDMTVVHPTSGPVVWDPGNFNLAPRRKIYSVLPAIELRRLAIYFKNLKEEPMQVEGMVH